MKVDRPIWPSRTSNLPTSEKGRAAAGQSLSPVESANAPEPDRRRSLRQEMDEIEAKAIGIFEGRDQVIHSAHEVAEKLASLGTEATLLVRADKVQSPGLFIDES